MANEEIKDLNLVQKLAGIRKMVEVIRKNKSGYAEPWALCGTKSTNTI